MEQRGPDCSGPRCWRSGRRIRGWLGVPGRAGPGCLLRGVRGLVPLLEAAPDPPLAWIAGGLVPAALARRSRPRPVAVAPAAHSVVSAPAATAAEGEPEQGEEQEDEQDEAQEVE